MLSTSSDDDAWRSRIQPVDPRAWAEKRQAALRAAESRKDKPEPRPTTASDFKQSFALAQHSYALHTPNASHFSDLLEMLSVQRTQKRRPATTERMPPLPARVEQLARCAGLAYYMERLYVDPRRRLAREPVHALVDDGCPMSPTTLRRRTLEELFNAETTLLKEFGAAREAAVEKVMAEAVQ